MKRMGSTVVAPAVALAIALAYPLLLTTPFQQRLGALVLLYAIGGIGVEHRRRLCRPDLGRACRVLRLRRLWRARLLPAPRLAPDRRAADRRRGRRADRRRHRRTDAAALRPLLQHGDDRRRRAGAPRRHQHRMARRRPGTVRAAGAAHPARPLLHLVGAVLLPVSRRARRRARGDLGDGEEPHRLLSARHSRQRTRCPRARRRGAALQARWPSCSARPSRRSPARSMR